MRWFIYVLISLAVAFIGVFAGGSIGAACVRWYHISSFEGGSGFFVIGIGLVGGIVGLATGLVTAAVLSPQNGPGYCRAFGAAAGVLAALALIATGLSWFMADIPPEIDGRPLKLEVEIRLPVTVINSPAMETGESTLGLSSLSNHVVRAQKSGVLNPKAARLENGRWIVPGEVELFTMRGLRSLDIKLNGEEVNGYLVPLPARPGRQYFEWSEWGPRPPASEPPWPDTEASYRFRVQKIPEPAPGPTDEEMESQREAEETAAFESIPEDSPIPAWFSYTRYGAREDRRAIAIKKMTAKPGFLTELQELMIHEDPRIAEEALRLVAYLPAQPPELIDSVAAAGRDIAERIRKVNATSVEQDPDYLGAADVSIRFAGWMPAITALREKAGSDFTPELKTILELSRVRPDSYVMQTNVCRVASYYMKERAGLEPLPTDPPPR